MEKLSPEDISRARELAAEHIVKSRLFERTHISLLDNLTIPYSSRKIRDFVTAEVMADFALAYSAAENERLTQELKQAKHSLKVKDIASIAIAVVLRGKCADEEWAKLSETMRVETDRVAALVERADAALTERDRLKGALEKIGALKLSDRPFSMMHWIRRAKREALAALRPEGE